jgi:hypothetical protein
MEPIDDRPGSQTAGNANVAQEGTHPVLVDDGADVQTAGNGHVAQEGVHPVLVWDLPTRVFHWTLVVSFFSALATGDPDRFRDLHVYFGYVVLGLICFRVFWGLAVILFT